jgi:hypothetical protein
MRAKNAFLAGAVLLALALALSGCTAYIPGLSPPVSYPRIVSEKEGLPDLLPSHTFSFGNGQITVTSPVDRGVYEGARQASKSVTIYDDRINDTEWQAGLYRAMIDDPAQDAFYQDLLTALREVRTRNGLGSDQYLELMAVFVQSLPYDSGNSSDPRYPIETYTEGEGDCDDRSLLLAGLLAREGYSVALLYFGPEKHMAVGVACPGWSYRDSGYAFVETTNVTLIGVSEGKLAQGAILESNPLVIPVGNGTKGYGSFRETRALWEEVQRIREETDRREADLEAREEELRRIREDLDAQEKTMERVKEAGKFGDYNRMVSSYNEGVVSYNALLEDYRSAMAGYESIIERHNFIVNHQHDREGTYRAIFG